MSDKPQALIHVVEDDAAVSRLITATLERFGYRHAAFSTGGDFLRQLRVQVPDVAILDLGLPDRDGLALVHRLALESGAAIIIISGRAQVQDRVTGLELGADDYIAKPFSLRLLIARIRAILRRAEPLVAGSSSAATHEPAPANLTRGRLFMDPARHQVMWDGETVSLTVTEFLTKSALMVAEKAARWMLAGV